MKVMFSELTEIYEAMAHESSYGIKIQARKAGDACRGLDLEDDLLSACSPA